MIFRTILDRNRIKKNRESLNVKHKKYAIIVLIAFIILFFSVFFYVRSVLEENTIYHGIYIDDLYVGGLTQQEALALLATNIKESESSGGIILLTPFCKYRLPLADIGYAPLYGKAVDKAFTTARYGTVFKRLLTIRKLRKQSLQIYPEMCYNKEKLSEIIRSIGTDTDKKPINADIKVLNGHTKITPHQSGYLLDRRLTLKKIERSLDNRITKDIELFVVGILPDITTQMVDKILCELGAFSTYFNTQNEGRSHNIKTACNKINQKLLLPGESFSLDKVLGNRTEENGYKQARVIINNELVDGLGGGICQVTSTLYNSVLLSGLKVLERRNHTLPLTYIEVGRDATISQGYIDFRFTNNLGYAVIIESKVIDNQIRIAFWGCEPLIKIRKTIRTNIIEKIAAVGVLTEVDEKLKPGEAIIVREAIPGYKVEVYLDTKDMNGKIIKIEKISVDYYIPQQKKIKISPFNTPLPAEQLSVISFNM